jgi:hypothetical protein
MEKRLIPRDDYRKIKAMSRQEMSEFFYNFSNDIAQDAVSESTVSINLEDMKARIGQIKGIGSARLDEIMDVIEEFFNKKNE